MEHQMSVPNILDLYKKLINHPNYWELFEPEFKKASSKPIKNKK